MRNLVAAEMDNKFKSKRFTNDRSNRRANSNRNKFDWRDEIELDSLDEINNNNNS